MKKNYNAYVTGYKHNKYCISLNYEGRRLRFYTGAAIGVDSYPNKLPENQRKRAFESLLEEYVHALDKGWQPGTKTIPRRRKRKKVTADHLYAIVEKKEKENLSDDYITELNLYAKRISRHCKGGVLNEDTFTRWVESNPHWSNTSYNNARRIIGVFETGLRPYGYKGNWKSKHKPRRTAQKLHKPYHDVPMVLEDIRRFSSKLHLCCILTYGCLLRPHQEIRNLTWGDFSKDLSTVSLSGNRTKGKRNRVIPVPKYILPYLCPKENHRNIFTGTPWPHNPDFFKTLWGKYKYRSTVIEKHHTLYSFRHTGAIKVYQKTGSLTVLQQVMGHADLTTSLTYLRGLEIQQVEVNHLPEL